MDLQAEIDELTRHGGDADDALLSVMTWPRDGEARRLDFAARIYDQLGGDAPRPVLAALVEQDLAKIRAARLVRERRGQIAASLLIRIESIATRGRPHQASLSKAARWYLAVAARSDNTGSALPHSRRSIENCWREFAPVAHLWAAWQVATLASGADAEVWLDQLVGLGEAYLQFAAHHHPPSAGRTGSVKAEAPLLDPVQCWRLPPNPGVPLPPIPRFTPSDDFDEIMRATPA